MIMTAVIGLLALVLIFFLVVMVLDGNRFVIREYEVVCDKLEREGTFVLLSDLHGKCYGKKNEALVRAIDQVNPDGILIAGDMITAAKHTDNRGAYLLLEQLAGRYPVYYGNGNHESRSRISPEEYGNIYEGYYSFLQKVKIEPLVNEHVELPKFPIRIYGLEIDRYYYKKFEKQVMTREYLEEKLGKTSESDLNLLIAHNPEYFPSYAAWGADLVVSGHVHGGIMRLPYWGGVISPRLRLFPRYDGGIFKEGSSTMVLSRGLGTHTLPVRIFNPGELVVIHLKTH